MRDAPWTSGPRELLDHAKDHLEKRTDVDNRFAMISVDNGVELMLKTYLTLPKRATGLALTRKEREERIKDFPTALSAVEQLAPRRVVGVPLDEIEWFHQIRNQLYHEGNAITVERGKVTRYLGHAEVLLKNLFGTESTPPRNGRTLTREPDRPPRRYERSTLTEETYWAQLQKNAGESYHVARRLIEEYASKPGIQIDPRQSSLVVKYDMHHTGQLVSLFFIDTQGRLGVWPEVIARQISRTGLDGTLADAYGEEARQIMHMPKSRIDYYYPVQSVDVKRFTHAVDEFLRVLESAALEA